MEKALIILTPGLAATRGVIAAWFVFIPLMLWAARRHSQKEATNTRDYTSVFGIALQGLGFAIVWAWRGTPSIPLIPQSDLVQWIIAITAVVLAFGSVLFLIAAIRTLGKQWSLVAGVVDSHALITSGPYAIVRHPIYLAMMGALGGYWSCFWHSCGDFGGGVRVRVRDSAADLRRGAPSEG